MKTCAAFWNHTNLRNDNRIFPCCRFKEPIQKFDGNLESVLLSEEYVKLRSSNVEDLPQCSKCMYEESKGKESLREVFNKQYKTDFVKLKYIEIGFDNICDLACDGCWDEWSHIWALKKNIPIKQAIKSTDEITHVPEDLEKVVFLGGEPLMTNRHKKFLKQIKNLKNLTVEYQTNGMHNLDTETELLLDKCKEVKFIVSIDGVGSLNDKVRQHSNWEQVSKFAIEINKKYETTIHTTIHKNNWHGIDDLKQWVENNSFKWSTNVLTYPVHLDIINLSYDDKVKFIALLDNVPNANYIKEHIS